MLLHLHAVLELLLRQQRVTAPLASILVPNKPLHDLHRQGAAWEATSLPVSVAQSLCTRQAHVGDNGADEAQSREEDENDRDDGHGRALHDPPQYMPTDDTKKHPKPVAKAA